jgi:serine protease Do
MLLGCSAAVPASGITEPAKVGRVTVDDLMSKTVALVTFRDGPARAYCSGIWVGPQTILTANHCVLGRTVGLDTVSYATHEDVYPKGAIEESEPAGRDAVVAATDPEHDLALLYAVAAAPAHRVAPLAVDGVQVGQRVYTMGSPLGQYWSFSSGDVAALRYGPSAVDGSKILFIQSTAPISPGNSGGGLFNEYGELLGVCHATFTRGQNMNVWVHYSYAAALIVR